MTVLIGIDGKRLTWVLDHASRLLAADSDWLLLHVDDPRPAETVEHALLGLPGRRGPDRRAERQMAEAQAWNEDDIRSRVRDWTRATGQPAQLLLAHGQPEQELIRAAGEHAAQVIVLAARNQPGPASLGPVARFVVDHAPCPVLLLRG